MAPAVLDREPWRSAPCRREDLENPIAGLLPSTTVRLDPLPLMVRLRVMSRSPVALASSFAPAIVNLIVPAGRLIVFEPPRASAAMMAERSEMWPEASLPVLRFAATVSSVVLTTKVERTKPHASRLFPRDRIRAADV